MHVQHVATLPLPSGPWTVRDLRDTADAAWVQGLGLAHGSGSTLLIGWLAKCSSEDSGSGKIDRLNIVPCAVMQCHGLTHM